MIFYISYVFIWLVVIFQFIAIFVLIRSLESIKRIAAISRGTNPNANIAIGELAPTSGIELLTVNSETIYIKPPSSNQNYIILFVSPTCSVCAKIVAELSSAKEQELWDNNIVLYFYGSHKMCSRMAKKFDLDIPIYFSGESRVITEAFNFPYLPAAVIIDPSDKVLGYFFPTNAEEIANQVYLYAEQ